MNIAELFSLQGKVAVVTGAGQGLGRAIALAFAGAGADVIIAARRIGPVEAVAEEIRGLGRKALALECDLRDPESPDRLVQAALQEFGKLDVWVNNAGGADDVTAYDLSDTSETHWREVTSLNIDAVWRSSKAAANAMQAGGVIINMSSILAEKGGAGYGAYVTSKAAVNAMTRVLSAELAKKKIRVNAIAPGPVPTETFLRSYDGRSADLAELAVEWGIPMGRVGTPQDVAAGCLYLATDASAWVSGHVLVVAGGM